MPMASPRYRAMSESLHRRPRLQRAPGILCSGTWSRARRSPDHEACDFFRTIALTIAVVVLLSLAALPRPALAASRPVTATTIAGSPISVAVDTGDLTVTLDASDLDQTALGQALDDFVKP